MSVRQFDWRDLATLRHCRKDRVFLDSVTRLTRGDNFLTSVLFSVLAPSVNVFTCISNGNRGTLPCLVGQFSHSSGSPSSHLTFLSPSEALQTELVSPLIEYMMTISGERGAMRLFAEVDENSRAFEALRKCGFVIYHRQHIWRLKNWKEKSATNGRWRIAIDEDVIATRNLYNNLVPGLVQQIEPFSMRKLRGMVYYQDDELLGYVEQKSGPAGIWLQPFIHPDAQNLPELLVEMVQKISNQTDRPVYMCLRTTQSWLEPFIEYLGAESGARQAVLARQLMVQQKAGRAFAIPAMETGQAEISAPIAHMEIQQGYAPEKNNG